MRRPSGRGDAGLRGLEYGGGAARRTGPQEGRARPGTSGIGVPLSRPKSMEEVEVTDELRFRTGMGELDRVLGGGAVRGSLVLVGGAPGLGKPP